MAEKDLTDTIAAISTPIGEGGIGIVRISGKRALDIADRVFVCPKSKPPSLFKTHTTHYGKIVEKGRVIDEVLLTVMISPRTYTREDIVEINCHGGIVALRDVLELVLKNGARLAEPGEFTRRAFLNGRIDLAQAEAVLDIIRAKTDSALRAGLNQLKGTLSGKLNNCRSLLLDLLSSLEAAIDFPEEDGVTAGTQAYCEKIVPAGGILKSLLDNSRAGRILREGVHLVICGKPNAGKSSLLNALVKEERCIVTSIPGTTRDTVEEIIDIRGIPVRIVDTAGILEPKDLIEREAILRSRREIEQADLVILLFDASKKLSKEDSLLMNKLKKKTVIAAINKIDLKMKIEKTRIASEFDNIVEVSAKKLKNIELLEEKIAGLVYGGEVLSPESILTTNLRHIQLIRKAQKSIAQIKKSLDNKLPLDLIAQEAREALSCLDQISGREFSQDLLDKIFSDFCIGK